MGHGKLSHFAADCFGIFVFAVVMVIGAFVLNALAEDARKRGKSPVLIFLLVLLSFPVGLLVWMVIRPPVISRRKPPFPLGTATKGSAKRTLSLPREQ